MTERRRDESGGRLAIGARLAKRYRVLELLGQGGMGLVYAAIDEERDADVAIKLLRPELRERSRTVARFLREARAIGSVASPHVVRVTDVGTHDDGTPFFVMERLFGRPLSAELAARRRLPAGEAVAYVVQAARGAAAAHAQGVVHRDLKPENLFLVDDRAGRLVKVLDFGISKLAVGLTGRVTLTDTSLGTPAYMSPEQLRSAKHVDARSDVWSLGVILYELLSGRLPFPGSEGAEIARAISQLESEPIEARSRDIAPELASVVMQALKKHAAERWRSAELFARALEPFAAPGSVPARSSHELERTPARAAFDGVPARGDTLRDAPAPGSSLSPLPNRPLSLVLLGAIGVVLGLLAGLLVYLLRLWRIL